MSSTNKTSLGLNLFLGTDKIKFNEDINADNAILNTLITTLTNAILPIGIAMPYPKNAVPSSDFVIYDGREISRTVYAPLFTLIGTTYGVGDGSTTFNVPNYKGRTPVGYDASQSEFDSVGETGGSKTQSLTISQIPSHNHPSGTLTTSTAHLIGTISGHTIHAPDTTGIEGVLSSGINPDSYDGTVSINDHNHAISGSTASTGSGTAPEHNNLQPYITQVWIARAK